MIYAVEMFSLLMLKEFQTKLGSWLAMTVSAYAPFYNEETGKLDWMEETPYGNQS